MAVLEMCLGLLAPVDNPAVTKLWVSEHSKKSRATLPGAYSDLRATAGSTLDAR
jgi:hypothetical protein